MEDTEIEQRRMAGYRAAETADSVGQEVAEKSTGDTSPEHYPYTYWWKVGWNEYVAQRDQR